MAEHTPIQWCDSTVNPVMGCNGCELWSGKRRTCYAGQQHEWRGAFNKGFASEFTRPTLYPARVAKAARWRDLTGERRERKPWLDGLPRHIFISDMGDAFSQGGAVQSDGTPVPGGAVPFEFLKTEVVDPVLSLEGQRHRWLWLTKLPARLAEFAEWLSTKHGLSFPPHLWLGTSITSKRTLGRARRLAEVGDKHTNRLLSVEPLWEEISLAELLPHYRWVIIGGESKQGDNPPREFRCDWARKVIAECAEAGVPVFVKQLGAHPTDGEKRLTFKDSHGGNWSEWPQDLRVRQVPTGSTPSFAVDDFSNRRMTMANEELFEMDKPQSYRKLKKNRPWEEVGGRSYTTFVVKQLEKHGGWMFKDDLYKKVWKNYHLVFSEADLRFIKTNLPKWKNNVAWALASLTGQGIIATAKRDHQGGKRGLVVLLRDLRVPDEVWEVLFASAEKKSSFQKNCPDCNYLAPLKAVLCRNCGWEYEPPNTKTNKVPK